jgi:hypothetical protein
MEIVTELVPRLPALGAIIFEIVPDFIASTGLTAIETLLGQLNDVWAARSRMVAQADCRPPFAWTGETADTITPAMWENAIGALVTGLERTEVPADLADWTRSAERPLELYRYLAQEGRACSLVDTAPRTIRSLLTTLGEARTRHLLARFWLCSAPAYTNAEEARAFLDFLSTVDIGVPGLSADVAGDRNALIQIGMAQQ